VGSIFAKDLSLALRSLWVPISQRAEVFLFHPCGFYFSPNDLGFFHPCGVSFSQRIEVFYFDPHEFHYFTKDLRIYLFSSLWFPCGGGSLTSMLFWGREAYLGFYVGQCPIFQKYC
jgi:hypothetical protein